MFQICFGLEICLGLEKLPFFFKYYIKNKTQKTERKDPQSQLCHDPIQAGFRV